MNGKEPAGVITTRIGSVSTFLPSSSFTFFPCHHSSILFLSFSLWSLPSPSSSLAVLITLFILPPVATCIQSPVFSLFWSALQFNLTFIYIVSMKSGPQTLAKSASCKNFCLLRVARGWLREGADALIYRVGFQSVECLSLQQSRDRLSASLPFTILPSSLNRRVRVGVLFPSYPTPRPAPYHPFNR